MTWFSRFDGDDNEDLFLLQRSIWYGRGYESVIVQFFQPSIDRYKNCTSSIRLVDPITIILNKGFIYENYIVLPFIELISAYYRFLYGYQFQLPFPNFDIPKTDGEWRSHYRNFMCKEGREYSENSEFFPEVIHLLVIQNLPYAIELQKHLLLLTSRICNKKIMDLYDREIPFVRSEELKQLEKSENQFERLFRNEIVRLIETNKEDNLEFIALNT